ncbi:ABC transporter ATP-binding protein [Curtobacterium sp. MCSS17_015]|uniref:ATP-binding cassette domain-containing protein n=1 Tax=Curtobacterium sp. MCSS17_015 TaxID=2175666 RepID=UPI000DA7D5B5|nr:ABC transporter ATP-binding protein [Curtobacterium sp. MCSS17_015]WIB27141.1 ABC transporter ATP-binding protein [Curtobacterium sp. MCSS17_015]
MTSAIEVTDLRITSADGTPLVDGVSFSVDVGDRLGIVGESGSGKSLTALAVMGLLPTGLTASGSVRVGGVEVLDARERSLREVRGAVVAPVFQEPMTALDPLMRAGDQIAEPLRRHRGLRGEALRAAVREAIADVALADPDRVAGSFPWELSGGQRQRVAIAMALACRPRVLIADEPTTALDVTVQAQVLDLLDRAVTERGMGLLFISHDLPVVARTVDRVLVLEHGRAVEQGPVRDVIAAPTHPYTQRLVGSARALQDALDAGRRGGAR